MNSQNSLSSVIVSNTAAIVSAIPGLQGADAANLIDKVGERLIALAREGHQIEIGGTNQIRTEDLKPLPVQEVVVVAPPVVAQAPQKPAVDPSISITPERLICLEDGKQMKVLTRHLMSAFGLTPDQYRQKWNLGADYPMSAPAYSARRREIAIEAGFGHRNRQERTAAMAGNKPNTVATRVKRQYRKKVAKAA
jgi:predicted transcriptional regulator